MQLWNDFVEWLYSEDGSRILSGVVFPFLAIVLAGLIAALIGRSATKRLLVHHDRERRTATVSAMIGAARRAAKWNTLSAPEQQHAEHLAHDADVSMRLLPLGGAIMTADWATHELAEMKKNSVSFSFQAEQSLMEFRDRLVEWQMKPSRAKKLFKADLDLWAYESAQEDQGLVEKQQEWAKQQLASETGPIATVIPESVVPDRTVTESRGIWKTPSPAPAASLAAASPAVSAGPASTEADISTTSGAIAVAPVGAGPTASAPVSAPVEEPASDTGEQPIMMTPNPVSAQTVRQRTLPDFGNDNR